MLGSKILVETDPKDHRIKRRSVMTTRTYLSIPGLLMTTFILTASTAFAESGFDPKYERDFNIFTPSNQFRPTNPLNPAEAFAPNNSFNPANRFDPGNPANFINRFNPNNPFNPANEFNPRNPLNPANEFNPRVPFKPLNRPYGADR
jgi:hypothetical protein